MIIIDKLSHLIVKHNQKINELIFKVNSLTKKCEVLEQKKNIDTKINLVGCRDFLKKVFSFFCFLFSYIHHGKSNVTGKFLIDKNKNKDTEAPIKKFAQKVNLIEFIDYLAIIIEEPDVLSHFFFKELSIEFRNQDIGQITIEEIAKENIIKYKNAFNDYCKMNFGYIFSFFINECIHPNYNFNKLEINEHNFLNAIKNYNDKH